MSELEKEFVPYQEALTLKQLGFDEPCFGYYNIKNNNLQLFSDNLQDASCNSDLKYDDFKHCTAPLYQQVFRWFREKYGLYSSVEYYIEDYKYPCFLFNIKNKPDNLPIKYKGLSGYNTYEEAELACLRKLIEIVKQQTHATTN